MNDNMNDNMGDDYRGNDMTEAYEEEKDETGPGAFKSREEDLMGKSGREGAREGVAETTVRKDDFSVRTAMVRDVLKEQLKDSDSVSFSSISKGISRRTAAACFLEVIAYAIQYSIVLPFIVFLSLSDSHILHLTHLSIFRYCS